MASFAPTTRVKLVDAESRDDCAISPATVAAVTNAAYGVAILTDAARTFKVMYNESSPSASALGAAHFDGLALLQQSAVLYAVRDCKDKRCRRALNGAIAVNQLADAVMTQYQRHNGGLDATQAHVSTALTLGVGAYAAWHLWRDVQREREANKQVLVAPPGGIKG